MYAFFTYHLQSDTLAYGITIAAALVGAIIAHGILRAVLVKIFKRHNGNWTRVLVQNRVFTWVSNLAIPAFLAIAAGDIAQHSSFWGRFIAVLIVVIAIFLLDSLIRSVGDIYSQYEMAKTLPIKGILQILEIAVFIVGGILLVSIFVDRSPIALLSGLGAMTAIVTIVFKDAILGFVAGIQLTANNMVQVGDVVELPQREIGGTVIDISLVTVKLEGFDKTIISVPAYAFISEAFINRRGMVEAKARRIMRAISIDATTVTATNLPDFRAYLTQYLQSRTDLRQDMTLLVRQLAAEGAGIPIEVFAFTTATDLIPHENTQTEIFEHIYATLPQFDLKLYQRGVI